jgi:hypothetical protein
MKLPSLPLFTDTFVAETTHLTNKQIGMYIRILCWSWTKKGKAMTLLPRGLNKSKITSMITTKRSQLLGKKVFKQNAILLQAKRKHLSLSLSLFLSLLIIMAF